MANQIFISYASEDHSLVQVISKLIEDVSLRQLRVWQAGDDLKLGGGWFGQITTALNDSEVVVTLVTPTSLSRPWIYFESGFMSGRSASGANREPVPLCIGVRTDQLGPLREFQAHQILDKASLARFIERLFRIFEITYDSDFVELKVTTAYTVLEQERSKLLKRIRVSECRCEIHKYLINTLTPIRNLPIKNQDFQRLRTNLETFEEVAEAIQKIKSYADGVVPDNMRLYLVYKVVSETINMNENIPTYRPVIFSAEDASKLRNLEIPSNSLIHWVYRHGNGGQYFENTDRDGRNFPKEGEKSLYLTPLRLANSQKSIAVLGLSCTMVDGISEDLRSFVDEVSVFIGAVIYAYSGYIAHSEEAQSYTLVEYIRKQISEHYLEKTIDGFTTFT